MRTIHPLILTTLALFSCGVVAAQDKQSAPATRQQASPPVQSSNNFDLTEYGVQIRPEPRLIVMMAALDAAGFDPVPAGKSPGFFRAQVRKDQAELDQNLRQRLHTFYERNKLPAPATPADQAARYVSLAYALGPAPTFDAPPRSEELPSSVLEVLDFAPLLQEFYRKSGIEERLPAYLKSYQAEGDQMRRPTAEMVRFALSYLHTRPTITTTERVEIKNPSTAQKKKKDGQKVYSVRERERRFYIVPDLLGVPGAINFRVIADDYYAIAPPGTDPASSELRRAYLQYVIDPLVVRYNRDIAARREPLRQIMDESAKRMGQTASPDIFLMVSRSLVAAADARLDETLKLDALARETRVRLAQTKDAAARAALVKETQTRQAAIADDTVAELAQAYENGAALSFYFSEQLRGLEVSGFDISNFFADMIASFDPARELRRPAEYAEARGRAVAARKARQAQRSALNIAGPGMEETEGTSTANSALVKQLVEVDSMLRLKNYEAAEGRLRELMKDFPREPRIFFALGQTASLSARDAIDEDVQSERLKRALAHYRDAVSAASEDTDRALISRAHEAMGRILAFLDRPTEAAKEFDAAIQLGDIKGGAYQDALNGKSKLAQPQ
jgi:hypothetical protein